MLSSRRCGKGARITMGALDVGLQAPKRWRRLPFTTAGDGVMLSREIALRWDAGVLPSTTPQTEHAGPLGTARR